MEPAKPPLKIQAVFDEGHELEGRVLEVAGIAHEVIDRQREVELPFRINGRDVVVRAHMDGRHDLLVPTIVEVKKFRDGFWAKWKKEGIAGFPRYQWQISAEMHALGEEVLFVVGHCEVKRDDEGNVISSEIVEVDTRIIAEPPVSMAEIRAKLKVIEDHIQSGEPLPCGPVDYPCPFFFVHEDGVGESRTRVSDEEIETLASTIKRLERESKNAADALAETKRMMRDLMMAGGYAEQKIAVGDFNVTHVVSWQPERTQTVRAFEKNYVVVTKREKDK